jgi:ketosteroid isomerase-like protein
MKPTRNAIVWLALLLTVALAQADVPSDKEPSAVELGRTVAALDTRLFDAYNRCDLDTLAAIVADDLEFYHDKTGLSRGRAPFIEAIKNNICGKVHRDLVPGSLEVYPLRTYGAVEIGSHVFCDPRQTARCDPARSGAAKFVMLWQNDGGTWKLTRVISYDHVSDRERAKR